ncbi:MAG: DsrE family protein [Thiohalobacterales bacterium]
MKLGILVNTDRHLEHMLGITKATMAKNHELSIFIMDEGTRLLENDLFVSLAKLPAVSITLCEHSASNYGIDTKGLSKDISCASQFNNAMMIHNADRVIVL